MDAARKNFVCFVVVFFRGNRSAAGTIIPSMHQDTHTLADGSQPRFVDWDRELSMHAGWLRKVIYARTGEAQAVDDVFQQVALAAVEQRAPLADPTKAAAWLHRLAVVKAARYRRQQGRSRRAFHGLVRQTSQVSLNGDGTGLLGWLLLKERHELVRLALTQLPGRDAEILVLKYGERWSYRRIGERLGISEKAVDRRLDRARQRLRQQLAELGIDEGDGNE
jgi:RNA polymerase sigma factor (sigma-70 family)